MADLIHWNVRGLKITNNDKLNKCCAILEQVGLNFILNLHETHLNSDAHIPHKFKKFSHLYHIIATHAPNDDKGAGILLFINQTEEVLEKRSFFQVGLFLLKLETNPQVLFVTSYRFMPNLMFTLTKLKTTCVLSSKLFLK